MNLINKREKWPKCIQKDWSDRRANLDSGWSNVPTIGSNTPPKRSLRKSTLRFNARCCEIQNSLWKVCFDQKNSI